MKKSLAAVFSIIVNVQAAKYYVAPAPTGDDGAAGTIGAPFATMDRGQTAATAGDTIYFRGGIYFYVSTADQIGVTLNKNGAAGNPIRYWAYPGEVPVFDFSGMTAQQRIKGMNITGSWLHLRGIEMRGVPQSAALQAHEDWCIYINGGSNDVRTRPPAPASTRPIIPGTLPAPRRLIFKASTARA